MVFSAEFSFKAFAFNFVKQLNFSDFFFKLSHLLTFTSAYKVLQKSKIKIEIEHEDKILKTVVKEGQPVSKLNIFFEDRLIKSEILYSTTNTLKENFFITVMDSDGEDNPKEISKMLDLALKNNDSVITSNRKSRNDPLTIKILYRIHLFITFLFSFKWITFGNFTSFNSINLKNIFLSQIIFKAIFIIF